jgi:alkylation response protein AidB-like acyl-CoA dehydrogenase
MLDAYGSEDLKRQYIPGLASFQTLGSYCLTEPDSGSDSSALRTTAVKDGDHYIVNGSKAFISGSGDSKVYLVMLRHKGQEGPKGIFTLLLTPDMPGFHLGKNERKLGWCSQPTRVITFEDVRVPVSNQVGHANQGFHIAMHGLNSGRVNIASCSLGAAHASLDLAIDYTKQRKAFGKTVSDFQWTQFKLAEMATKLVTARLMTREAARHLDQGTAHSTSMSAMAKFYATDAAFEVVNTALQMYGGYGVLKDYPIQQYLRDCRVHQIIEGTNEVMRLMIGKDLIKNDTHMNS